MDDGTVELGIPGLTGAVEVARGGFSTIYRATQATMERTVAVKLIHATVVDPAAGEHFLREVRATGRLSQHSNVAPVYDVGTTSSGQPYLLMPFYEQGSLQHRLDSSGALPEHAAIQMARTLAATLDYVHDRGIVHRDVKPANVLLSQSDEPLLADFGVARLVDSSVPIHTTGANVVTWAYGPPEAFTGGAPTPAWDVYSLGATVYAMLTGQAPFVDGEDVNVFTVLNRIGNVEIPDLRDRGVSPGVADAVRRTMAKEPADRPATAAEFAMLLDSTPPAPTRAAPAPAVEAPPVERSPAAPERSPAPPEPELGPTRGTEPDAPPLEPAPAERAVPVPTPAPAPEHERVVAKAQEGDGVRGRAPWRPNLRDLVAVVAAGAVVVNLIAIPKSVFEGYGYLLEGGLVQDLDAWAATVGLIVGIVLVYARPGIGEEWMIGAAAAFVLFDLGLNFAFLDEAGGPFNDTFRVLRVVAAVLGAAVVVLAWRQARAPGPRIGAVLAIALIAGAVATFVGAERFAGRTGYGGLQWMVLVLLVLLLVRAFAYRDKTTGAPGLVVAGIVGVIGGLAEADWFSDDANLEGPLAALTIGFALVVLVGAVRWWQGAASRGAVAAVEMPQPSR